MQNQKYLKAQLQPSQIIHQNIPSLEKKSSFLFYLLLKNAKKRQLYQALCGIQGVAKKKRYCWIEKFI